MTDAIRSAARAVGLDVAAENRLKKADDTRKAEELVRSPTVAAGAKDEVKLSGLTERVNAASGFNADKVEAIKDAIRKGNYPLDPRGIAASFYSLEKLISGGA